MASVKSAHPAVRASRGRQGTRAATAGTAATVAALAVAHGAPGVTAIGPLRRRLFPRLAGIGRAGHVALTFDDGPDPRTTPSFLGLLASHRLHATFFLLGSMVARSPGLAGEIAAAGHEVGVHGYDHRYGVLRGPRALRDDLTRARDVVADASGTVPRFYRPPYGVLTSGSLLAARGLGLTPVLWSDWGREWIPGATPASVLRTVTAGLAGGSCVLLHDSDCTSPQGASRAALGALPGLLEECRRRGLRVGTVGEHGIGHDSTGHHGTGHHSTHHHSTGHHGTGHHGTGGGGPAGTAPVDRPSAGGP